MSSEKSLSNLTFVIPTIRDSVRTVNSVPGECDVRLEREGYENEARNRGIKCARTEYIALCDDDIGFTGEFISECLALVDIGVIVDLCSSPGQTGNWLAGLMKRSGMAVKLTSAYGLRNSGLR